MKKGTILADGSICLGTPKANRAKSLADLKSIGSHSPNFVSVFCRESDLGSHLAKRINATINKRINLLCLLYADKKQLKKSLNVGGALVQDRSGSSFCRNGLFTGTQAGHIGIGTYSINGKVASQQGLRFLQEKSAYAPVRLVYPNFTNLVALGLVFDSETELVPAFINQSSGKIETQAIHYMKGLIPVYIPDTAAELERQLITESHRIVDFFLNKKVTFLTPIEQRLQFIKNGTGRAYQQDPTDTKNLLFGGKESLFLEAVFEQFQKPASEFHTEIDDLMKNTHSSATDFAEKAEAAKEELES